MGLVVGAGKSNSVFNVSGVDKINELKSIDTKPDPAFMIITDITYKGRIPIPQLFMDALPLFDKIFIASLYPLIIQSTKT
jgi:hypothetical protein